LFAVAYVIRRGCLREVNTTTNTPSNDERLLCLAAFALYPLAFFDPAGSFTFTFDGEGAVGRVGAPAVAAAVAAGASLKRSP
jgi:hypothetical protein